MFIISFVNCFQSLTIGRQYIRDTFKEACDVTVKLAVANGASDDEQTIRNEIETDLSYISEWWGVFIGQPDENVE